MNNFTNTLINITRNFNYTIINSYPIDNFNYTIKDLDIQGDLYPIDKGNIKIYVNNTTCYTFKLIKKSSYLLFYIILLYLILLYLFTVLL